MNLLGLKSKRKLWFASSVIVTLVHAYLSLFPKPQDIPQPEQFESALVPFDFILHALAFFILMFLWGQLFRLPHIFFKLMLYGVLIELLQEAFTPRFWEISDLVGNICGALITISLLRLFPRLKKFI